MDLAGLEHGLLPVGAQVEHTAAVTAVLRDGPQGTEILLVVRREREGDPWSGQVALPGGKRLGSETPLETAVREAREEVGLELPACARVLGCLPRRAPANRPGMVVVPHVAVMESEAACAPGDEIASASWVPLREIVASPTTVRRTLPQGTREFPAFACRGMVIWGLTHRILTELLSLLPQSDGTPSVR